MKTFRLDPDSVEEVVQGWPLFLVTSILGVSIAWFANNYLWGRILIPLVLGFAIGPRIVWQLRQKYPTAKHLWLLSIGMATACIGVITRMAFPSWQGTEFDWPWISVAFVSILTFVLANRGNKEIE